MRGIFIFGLLLITGCATTKEFTQDDLRLKSDHNITIHTKDGRVISCKEGEYKIVDVDSGTILGKGRLLAEKSKGIFNENIGWSGAVTFWEIESVTDDEMTTFGKVFDITIVSGVILFSTYIFLLSHMHWSD